MFILYDNIKLVRRFHMCGFLMHTYDEAYTVPRLLTFAIILLLLVESDENYQLIVQILSRINCQRYQMSPRQILFTSFSGCFLTNNFQSCHLQILRRSTAISIVYCKHIQHSLPKINRPTNVNRKNL